MCCGCISCRQTSHSLRHASSYVSIRQHTAAYGSIRQHTSAYVSTRQHTSAYVSIRQHPSGCGCISCRQNCRRASHQRRGSPIRQQTSAYVSIRQHTSADLPSRVTSEKRQSRVGFPATQLLSCQYWCFCTSRASKVCTRLKHRKHRAIRQHTSAYVSIRQPSAYISNCVPG